MTDIVVKILVELLSVLALASKQIKQGRFKKFAKKLLGDSEIESVLRRLDRLTEDEARTTVAQTMGVVYGLVGNMKIVMEDGKASTDSIRQDLVALHHVLNEINKMKRDQLRWEVQQWLSPPDPSTNHNFIRKSRHSGTTTWFFESSALIEWKARGSLLWIHGKPGAGKSTLLSAIVQDVQGMHAAGLATMAYYYLDFRDVKKQDCYGLLSSVISRLSAESDSCFNILSQLYLDNTRGVQKPDLDALKNCLMDMLSLPEQGPIYIIIDGVDECPNSSGTPSAREEVLELIEELVDLKLSNLHLCVASRPEIDIRQVLEPLTSLQISLHDESGQKEDIIRYIKSAVRSDRRMRKWREEDQNLVIDTLSQKADGMFRWVVCQVDELRRCFPASIRSALEDLPESLDQTYERTLLGIDKQKRKYAQRLFQCLSVSIRPLRIDELAEILAIEFDATASPSFKEALRPLDAEEAVFLACSSLIAVVNREGGQVVQFAHFSAKEFLTSDRLATRADERLSCYHILPERAHTLLALAGLSVLLRLDDNIDRNAMGQFPLASYAARHWVDHAQFGNVSSHIEDVMERLFDPGKPHFAAWVWLYDIDHHWVEPMSSIHPTQPGAVPLYYAALCGFGGFVGRLLTSHSPDINSRGGTHTTPLHAAAISGHVNVISVLLKSGADPNSRDDVGGFPLHKILLGGHLVPEQLLLEITRLLINSGANVNATDDEDCTPLHEAAAHGYRGIAQQLLVSGAGLDARGSNQQTPLHMSCGTGKLETSRLFIDCGSDIDSQDINGANPLHAASANGHLSVAKLLVDHGAIVDCQNHIGKSPLDSAAWFGHLDIVRFFIESGAAVSVRDKDGWTPLHSASYQGQLQIAKFFLLECGFDVDILDGSERTPLHLASANGELDVAGFLIEHGANIHTKDDAGWNSLHVASQRGRVDVVRMLINTGIAVDVCNGTQMTPLAVASDNGKADVGRVLIERGADVNARDNESWAPLHFASQYGHLDMTRLLLDNGVDPNVQSNNLTTPLHLASTNGHLKVAELLIQGGAIVDMFNDRQQSPLDRAASNGKIAIARLLIDHGANLHSTDDSDWTPLHTASYSGHLGFVKLLLRQGADVGILNKANETASELASKNGEAEVAKLIAEYKSDADIRHNICSTVAEDGADEDGNGEGMASLHDAAGEGNIYLVNSMLERGVDINGRNALKETPLGHAAMKGQVDVVRLLVERGAELNSRNKWGETSLFIASGCGHLKVVKLLLEFGADVHAMTGYGFTPFQISVRRGNRDVADLLREHPLSVGVSAVSLHM